MLVDPKDVGRRKAQVIMLEDKALPYGFGQVFPGLDPPPPATRNVTIGAAHMDDQDRLGSEFHMVEHLCLADEIPDAFANQFGTGTVEHDEL